MKKSKLFLLILAAVLFVSDAAAQRKSVDQARVKQFLRRTSVVILHAHKVVKEGKVYTGDLAKSIAHQKMARRLFLQHKWLRAMHQSRLARLLAVKAIRANKGTVRAEWEITGDENEMMGKIPPDAELEAEMKKELPGESLRDEDVLKADPDVSIDEAKPTRGAKNKGTQ